MVTVNENVMSASGAELSTFLHTVIDFLYYLLCTGSVHMPLELNGAEVFNTNWMFRVPGLSLG